jgi:hypothetical protein
MGLSLFFLAIIAGGMGSLLLVLRTRHLVKCLYISPPIFL